MGAGYSTDEAQAPQIKTSYYTLLDVDRTASTESIRRAYRKKALRLHPDRNHGRELEATRQFADIQAAYDVLSDPHERAWYDTHEAAILGSAQDESSTGDTMQGIRVTSCDDITQFISTFPFRRHGDGNMPDAFYTELDAVFSQIAQEEIQAAALAGIAAPDLPPFGGRSEGDDRPVTQFYTTWNSFSTVKTFFWVDNGSPDRGSDRRARRAMERENKRARNEAVQEFNNVVRTLVSFARRRDPRKTSQFHNSTDRQQTLRDATSQQAARARREHAIVIEQSGYSVPDWARDRTVVDESDETHYEEIDREEFNCVACHKVFKSAKQFEAHENSKKHQKMVRILRRQLAQESAILGFDGVDSEMNGTWHKAQLATAIPEHGEVDTPEKLEQE